MAITELEWAKTFSNKLKHLLEEWGMTQKDLAKETGLSEPTISRCLRGDYIPSIRTLINIGHALDCDSEDLISFYDKISNTLS